MKFAARIAAGLAAALIAGAAWAQEINFGIISTDKSAAIKSLWYAQGLAAGCFLFARRSDFDAVGGFDELYFAGEEYWMSRALQRRGRFVLLPEAVISSARKQRKLGLVRLLSQAFAPLLRGPSVLRSRDGLPLWYGGLRDDRAVDLDLGRRGGGPGRGPSAP